MGIHLHIHVKMPGFVKAIGKAVGSCGRVIGAGIGAIDKIPGLSVALNAIALAVPGADIAVTAFDVTNAAIKVGKMAAHKSKVVAAAAAAVPPAAQNGFQAGVGLLSQPGITPSQFAAMRNALPTQADKDGFDMATALQVGGASGPAPPPGLSPADQAGWYIAHGAVHGLPGTQANTVQNLVGSPLAAGAAQAAEAIHTKHASWWHRLLVKLKLADALPGETPAPDSPPSPTSPAPSAPTPAPAS
jgi:hypothetical protein